LTKASTASDSSDRQGAPESNCGYEQVGKRRKHWERMSGDGMIKTSGLVHVIYIWTESWGHLSCKPPEVNTGSFVRKFTATPYLTAADLLKAKPQLMSKSALGLRILGN